MDQIEVSHQFEGRAMLYATLPWSIRSSSAISAIYQLNQNPYVGEMPLSQIRHTAFSFMHLHPPQSHQAAFPLSPCSNHTFSIQSSHEKRHVHAATFGWIPNMALQLLGAGPR